MLCRKSLKNNGHTEQKKLSWKTSPSASLIHWKFKRSILRSETRRQHLSFPTSLSHSTTNVSYRKQRKGKNQGQK